MRRILSLPGLAVAVWVSCLAFEGLLVAIVAFVGWHPHYAPVVPILALVVLAGLALVAAAIWRIISGPRRGRALSYLLLGVAPLCFVAGHLNRGYAIHGSRHQVPDPWLRPLGPLGDAVMDLEARFRYPQRTYGEKVVMISARMPEEKARAQVAAMDRHIRAMETRLGRPTKWTVHWARGPLVGMQGRTVQGLCMGTIPGEAWEDAEGLNWMDRHEVGHCVINSLCPSSSDPPAVLTEGWAESNVASDRVERARRVKEARDRGNAFTTPAYRRILVSPSQWAGISRWRTTGRTVDLSVRS